MTSANGRWFEPDGKGIRGKANNGRLTAHLALKLGQAAGITFQNGDHRHRALIGKDTRLSCYLFEQALTAGLLSAGMDVLLTGPIPSPGVAEVTRSMRADLGVMITAGHELYEENGFKLFGPDGLSLSEGKESEIETLINSDIVSNQLAESPNLGRATRIEDAQGRYIELAKVALSKELSFEGMRIVVDCANGAAYQVAPQALKELGAEVIPCRVDPNGENINENCGFNSPRILSDEVHKFRADIGIAFDGSGSQIIVSDEKGSIIDDKRLRVIIAHRGGSTRLTERDWATLDSGLVAVLQVLAVVKNLGLAVSEVVRRNGSHSEG